MGLNNRGRGRGRIFNSNFHANAPRQGVIMGQGSTFIPGTFNAPQSSFGVSSFRKGPAKINVNSKTCFRKYPQKHFRKKEAPVVEIDLTKPWVTEEIKIEETKKQELLERWKRAITDENWNNYQKQKRFVEFLYEKAKFGCTGQHPYKAALWENNQATRYYCETCDKSFKSDEDLIHHQSEHETCGREGCEFTAHPKIIAKHVQMQHKNGLFKRIGKLYTKEDIDKWIEERKKRYPTRKVVEEKKILEQEKINRGERIKENDSKFNKSFLNKNKSCRKRNIDTKSNKTNRHRRTRKNKKPTVIQLCLQEETVSTRKGVPAFSGIRNGTETEEPIKNDLNISDDDWETECKPVTSEKPILNHSLGLLAVLYNSDEENHNEEEPVNEKKVEHMSTDEGSGPEEISTLSCKEPLPEEKVSCKRKLVRKNENRDRKRKTVVRHWNPDKKSLTLLEKLLKSEIRHERNVILQCVNYIVKNNFFQE